ncbi:hypothetical protein SFRURICE_002001 [Spodoptera frugiperda]|nr:hypothetical protein SFRURICE_002001 [Spodoptera frugiperda]
MPATTVENRCNSCKPGSTVDTTMTIPAQCLARPRDMNDRLGSRNEINQTILLEEKKKKTIDSTSLDFGYGDRFIGYWPIKS